MYSADPRTVSKVPLYALLLFGGPIDVNHLRGGLTVGGRTEGMMRLRAWPRIAILVQQLRCVLMALFHRNPQMITTRGATHRRLLDAALLRALDGGSVREVSESPVIGAILALLRTDGVRMATASSSS